MKGIKKMSFAAMAALAMVSCSNHDEWMSYEEFKAAQYDAAFVQKYGTIDPNHTWGFGSVTTRAVATRAAATWDGNHTCAVSDWDKVLDFSVPSNAVDLTKGSFTDAEKKASEFVIPASHNGDLNFNYAFNIPAGAKIYNLGKTTSFTSANYDGLVTFYNVNGAEFRFVHATATRHTFINIGTLTLVDYAHVGEVYNGGTLVLEGAKSEEYPAWNNYQKVEVFKADIPNDMKIYSNGTGGIMADCDVDLKSVCDIHGTINVTGDLKIQNSTSKYICGIEATGTVENVDGPFYTSYVEADQFSVDGNETYLLPGGHIKAKTVHVYNSGCSIKAADGYNALIEAKDFIFENDNDFERTVSDNVYFKISGSVDVSGVTNGNLKEKKKFDNAEAYIAANGNPNDKLNAGKATGSPACGNEWTVGTPDEEPGNDETKDPEKVPGVQGLTKGRIFCEDLGSIGDFDFNDVVFDAVINDDKSVDITVWAAGGVLDLEVAGVNVHGDDMLGAGMVNTGVAAGKRVSADIHLTAAQAEAMGIETIEDIPVVVKKNVEAGYNEDILLKNTLGHAPQKICVPLNTKWVKEYEDISNAYRKFKQYVGNSSVGTEAFTEDINEEYLY